MLAIGNLLGGPIIFLDRPGPTQTYPCLRHCLKCNSSGELLTRHPQRSCYDHVIVEDKLQLVIA